MRPITPYTHSNNIDIVNHTRINKLLNGIINYLEYNFKVLNYFINKFAQRWANILIIINFFCSYP